MKKEKWMKICPKCGSTNISPYTKAGLSEGEILIDYCKNCNYGYPFGGFFPEVEESKIELFRTNLIRTKYQKMKSRKINNTYFLRLERGEKIIESLRKFCAENNISAGYFSGIGALDEAELAHYIVKNKKYTYESFRQPLEIINMTGNVTIMNKEIYLHCHITLSDVNMDAIGGHLKEGIVSATCEIVLVKLDAAVERKYDEVTGLNLIDL